MNSQPLLIYDGDCGFCTRTAAWLAGWAGGRVELQPWQAIPERLAAAGLTPADGMTQVWLVGPGDKAQGGAAAVNAVLGMRGWLRPLAWLYRLPGIRQFEDWAYRWVADHRYQMPGGTAACRMERG